MEFDYFLAAKLGMPVATLRHTLSAEEHLYWQVYYGRETQRGQIANGGR